MKETMKKMGAVVGILLFGGGALFVISVIMMLFGGSMHMLEATIAGGVALILWGILRSCGVLSGNKHRRYAKGALALVLAACVGWIGYGYYLESIPTVSDRELMIHEYAPFEEGTKAVMLDEESTLQFTEDQRIRIDGATALYPVYSGFVQAVYPEGEYRRYDGLADGGDKDGY
ncbi:MAG: hypothetical protein II983_05415, partial [Firmicutes bacterium]|nr:hypothetical protein [Bacillota bacterium]